MREDGVEMTSPWKPQNGFHRDLEISHRTRDSHIPTADYSWMAEKNEEDLQPVSRPPQLMAGFGLSINGRI